HGRVQRVVGVDGRGAAFDVVHEAVLVADDQGPLELTHVLGVDPEIGLQRDLDLDTLGDVDERPTRPDRAVQRGELVVPGRDDGAEVCFEGAGLSPRRVAGLAKLAAVDLEPLCQEGQTTPHSYCPGNAAGDLRPRGGKAT